MVSDLLIRLRALLNSKSVERDLDEELRFHFEQQVEKFLKAGVPLAEAQRRARLTIGGGEQIKEECRDARGVGFLENVVQDMRFGLRSLRKSPGFTVVAILTLTLGIGLNTALFTIVDGVLLNPLPFPQADRLVSLWERDVIDTEPYNVVSGGVFTDWQRRATSFEQIALVGEDRRTSRAMAAHCRTIGTRQCSYNLFSLLGVQPGLGRFFAPEDDRRGAARR